jgi:serine protease Do
MMKVISLIAVVVFGAIPAFAQDPGWIGLSIEDGTDQGAVVRRVQPNSPADKAGMKEGDVILEFNKEAVAGVQQLTRLVRETPVGRTVDVKVRRDNRDQTLKVTTERGPAFRAGGQFQFYMPDLRVLRDRTLNVPRVEVNTTYTQAGIRVEQLTDQLRDFFGVFSNTGVLVASVDPGSTAEKAGVKAGDVITSIAGKTIRTPADFSRELRAAGSKPMLKVFRDKKERDINFE